MTPVNSAKTVSILPTVAEYVFKTFALHEGSVYPKG